MSFDVEKIFAQKLFECDRHVAKIKTSKSRLSAIFPLTLEKYERLDDVEAGFVDQLIFRFSKLQDTLGEKIFPAILALSKENVKKKTFIDILNRLEELEVVDKNEWLSLREIRNEIAHEYPTNTQEIVDGISKIYASSDRLIRIYEDVVCFCKEKNLAILLQKE